MSALPADPLTGVIARIAQGDEKSLAELHRRISRKVHAFAHRHLDDAAAAEDVVTETFYEVWRTAARFAGASRVTTWVLGIARHKALDELRRRGHYTALPENYDTADESESSKAFEQISRDQVKERLLACVKRLPAEQRECIHLVFYEELTLAEIAALQGVPENTVKTRLFHARRKLRAILGDDEITFGLAA